jgi:hypothetical protein
VSAGGDTLYGLNENQKHDERYRGACAACMRSRGYTGQPGLCVNTCATLTPTRDARFER